MVVRAMWVVSVAFALVSLTLVYGGDTAAEQTAATSLVAVAFATVGAILVSRLPGNAIGWLLAAGGLSFALGEGATALGVNGLVAHPGSVPGAIWFAWLSEWIWAPAVGSVVGLALVYPSGQLVSPRWRPVAAAAIVLFASLSLGSALGPWTDGVVPVPNPLAINGPIPADSPVLAVLSDLLGLFAVTVPLLAVSSMVVRYRRVTGVERAQIRWFAAAAAVSVPAFLVSTFLYQAPGTAGVVGNIAGAIAYVGFALLPVAIGIAILRYRLYEIDRLISRSIAYGAITAILAAVFVAVVLAVRAILGPVTGSSTIAIAGSTLLVAALFQPIRRRVQRIVDRRFNRSRYDAEGTLAAFAARLRDEVDLEALRSEILATVGAAVEPSSVSLWLRE